MIFVCFLLSDVFFRMISPGLQLLARLLFRYVFNGWSHWHVMIVPAETDFVLVFWLCLRAFWSYSFHVFLHGLEVRCPDSYQGLNRGVGCQLVLRVVVRPV